MINFDEILRNADQALNTSLENRENESRIYSWKVTCFKEEKINKQTETYNQTKENKSSCKWY